MKTNLKHTYLVQRLCKPRHESVAEAFSFGGGFKNGGFSDEAMNLLRPVFSFDYMGSAEFEFGAVPEFFSKLVQHREEYDFFETDVNNTTIYIMGKKEFKDETIQRVQDLAHKKSNHPTKEAVGLDTATGLNKYVKQSDNRFVGWLELDNTFAFFCDKEVFEKFKALFN